MNTPSVFTPKGVQTKAQGRLRSKRTLGYQCHTRCAMVTQGALARPWALVCTPFGVQKQLRLCLLALFLFASPVSAATPDELLNQAESAFAEGVQLRGDSVKAKPAFAQAAGAYDELWKHGFHTPELALNRARAHRLAGNLPRCIAALQDGLAVARFSRPLQVELTSARDAVEYPLEGDLAAQCRPPTSGTVSSRMSPTDAWVLAGFAWLVACLGVARFAMTRAVGWLVFAGVCVAGLALLGWLWVQDTRQRQREESLPLLVLANDSYLRKGNTETYPARIESILPKGVEVRELTRRGGWVQVRLSGGSVGWLPEQAMIPCGRMSVEASARR
ncbi:MAG: hypothetical protein L0241_30365 [Planctomycetia bacterium]|nr:hypothetical protein [Planctomycetia bacterium]